jgi:hypothetical protein
MGKCFSVCTHVQLGSCLLKVFYVMISDGRLVLPDSSFSVCSCSDDLICGVDALSHSECSEFLLKLRSEGRVLLRQVKVIRLALH